MENFPISKKYDARYWANEKFKKYNLRTPQAVVSHQSTQSTRRSAKTWELGQQQAMVHPRNCSSSNIRFIGLFYSCLAGKLGRDLVAAAGCCCTLDRTHIQPRPGHRFNLRAWGCLYSEVLYWCFHSQPIQLKPNYNNDNKNNQNQFMSFMA